MDNQGHNKPQEGRVQDLYRLTAQIRSGNGNDTTKTVGTAFAVGRNNGLLVTCRHVIENIYDDQCTEGMSVWVYFDQVNDCEHKLMLAHVHKHLVDYGDDVVILRLDKPPLPPEVAVAIIGDVGASVGYAEYHRFSSYGFRRLDDYNGVPAWGRIINFSTIPKKRKLHAKLVTLESSTIDSGMSGAPVLDLQRNLVVCIISETWDSKSNATDRDTNFAVDAHVLSLLPFNLKLHKEYNLPLENDPPPDENARLAAAQVTEEAFPLKPVYYPNEPSVPIYYQARKGIIEELNHHWSDPTVHITGLIGLGGEGKTVLTYKWTTDLLAGTGKSQPDGVFWWDFQKNSNVDAMAEAAMKYLYGEEATQRTTNTRTRIENIGAMITAEGRRILFVMDGLEKVQHSNGGSFGRIRDSNLRRLFEHFAAPGHESFCLVTSRIQPPDLMEYTTYCPPAFSFSPYANALADLILSDSNRPPFTIGVFGEWGSGKSTMLKLIAEKVRRSNNVQVVKLNAWRTADESWLGLMKQMLTQLGKSEKFSKRDLKQAQQCIDKRFEETVNHMNDVRKSMERLMRRLSENDRILAIIDDLDRCPLNITVEILQVVQIVLNDLDRFIVCLACDPQILIQDLEEHHEEILQKTGMTGIEYLNKVIQIHFMVPKISVEETKEYLSTIGDIRIVTETADTTTSVETKTIQTDPSSTSTVASEGETSSAMPMGANEVAAIRAIAQYLPTPRMIKRLVYIYQIVRSLIKVKSGQLSPKVVVRWLAVILEWPHAAEAMVKRFSLMKNEEADSHGDALLVYLWEQLKPDYYTHGPVDPNPKLLEDLLSEDGGWIDRSALDYLKTVTMNFGPYF